jgi:iron complex outermembrane recepter protein
VTLHLETSVQLSAPAPRRGSRRPWIAGLAFFVTCVAAHAAEEASKSKERSKEQGEAVPSEAGRPTPRAQTLGKDVSGVFVNSTSSNSGYSPAFVMRGFPGGLTLFDGAAHGFTAQDIDLSTVDHVEFYKGPSAMLFGKASGGYGGAANYIRKTPTDESFARGMVTIGAFDVRRITIDANEPLLDSKNLLFRLTGSGQNVRSFVDFVRLRGFDLAPAIAFTSDNGDRLTLRAEYSASRAVSRDGVPADPIFLHVPREFYGGVPANEHATPHSADFTLTHEHAFDRDWSLTTVVDYYFITNDYGWFQGWGYDGFQLLTLG